MGRSERLLYLTESEPTLSDPFPHALGFALCRSQPFTVLLRTSSMKVCTKAQMDLNPLAPT
jgi:hypothetical protein